jgi:hypothetical protein
VFHSVTLGGRTYAAHVYATPLYVDEVRVSTGPYAGLTLSLVYAATSNGWVYAVNAFAVRCGARSLAPGAIVWQTRLGDPAVVPGLDGGVPMGVLSTPTIDLAAVPVRIYVTALDGAAGWRVFALDIASGLVVPGWPLGISDVALGAAVSTSQRGALNLSPSGDTLYVTFAAARGPGSIVAVDTGRPRVLSSFATAAASAGRANAGMWGAGGPAVDTDGHVYMTTGNSPADSGPASGVWGNSLLKWSSTLRLTATYTPFNYCLLDRHNIDLGSSTPVILPDLGASSTSTPRLVAFGSKQGNVYLVNRDRLPGGTDRRPPCSTDSTTDRSQLPREPQPQFKAPGPLNVFGPYTEEDAEFDRARMRSTPTYYRGASGASYLFVTGSTMSNPANSTSVPPGLVRLRVVTEPRAPAYLSIDRQETGTPFLNPGSPVVTSAGSSDAIVWVLDPNMPRTAPLVGGPGVPVTRPVLYAFDATTLALLWRSRVEDLEVGGKYSSPTIAHGVVFVGTDRVQAFGLTHR